MIVTLVGQMGAGKSTVGRLLAARWADLGFTFVDLDATIEASAGARIVDLFATYGEAEFRVHEMAALTAILGRARVVLATGGGAPCQPGAMDRMLAAGPVVWLDVAPARLAERLSGDDAGGRPLLAGLSTAEREHFLTAQREARRPHYTRAPWHVAGGRAAPEVAAEIDRLVGHLVRGIP